jgi:cbb3-type cytochrome oxidase maturation protein
VSTILFMVSVALILSTAFVICYVWALRSGQYDDLQTPALRMLKENFNDKENLKKETK